MQKIPNNSFCILPFIHIHLTNSNKVHLCCYSEEVKSYDDSFDFLTDPDFNKIRNDMLSDQPVRHCEKCYNIEKDGGESFRIRDTNEWLNKLKIDAIEKITPELIYYDFRNDNTCNLSCRMCNPHASTQIEKEFIKLGWHSPNNLKRYTIKDIVDIDKIKRMYVAGGEPTLMPEFKNFLQQAIEKNRTDVELRIITNATNINKEIATLLSQFSNKEFVVSIDGYDQVNKYIRWPSNWNSWVANVKQLKEIAPNYVSFSVTVSMWNISNLSRLVYFLEDEFGTPYTILLNEAVDDNIDNSSPFNFPNKDLALKNLELLKNAKSYKKEEYFKNKVDYFISKLETTEVDITKLKNFFKYNDALDQSRNVKLVDYIPELEQCRSYITKQT